MEVTESKLDVDTLLTTSTEIKNIACALFNFHNEISKVNKDAQGYGYKYATLPNVLEAIKEPLANSGLVFTQFHIGEYSLATLLIHVESGEYFKSIGTIIPVKKDPQGVGGSITYQRRYQLLCILGLQVDDDDAHYASGKQSKEVAELKPKITKGDKVYKTALEKLKTEQTTIDKIADKYIIPDNILAEFNKIVNGES